MRELAKIALRDRRASDVYSNYFILRRLISRGIPDVLAVTSGERATFLAERGIDAVVAPLGYSASEGRLLDLERDIDVLLLGTMNVPHRHRVVRGLRGAGVPVMTAGDYGDPSLWGALVLGVARGRCEPPVATSYLPLSPCGKTPARPGWGIWSTAVPKGRFPI